MDDDDFELGRFVDAQQRVYDQALAEITAGRKRSHWMWFVFPQFTGLGASELSRRFAIESVAEASVYLAHPVLGPRLIACCEATLALRGKTALEIFGSPDDMKLRSCATLFAAISPPQSAFHQIIDKYFDGVPDPETLRLIASGAPHRAVVPPFGQEDRFGRR